MLLRTFVLLREISSFIRCLVRCVTGGLPVHCSSATLPVRLNLLTSLLKGNLVKSACTCSVNADGITQQLFLLLMLELNDFTDYQNNVYLFYNEHSITEIYQLDQSRTSVEKQIVIIENFRYEYSHEHYSETIAEKSNM